MSVKKQYVGLQITSLLVCHFPPLTCCLTHDHLEILEGKDGHSYEVDIWSTGVVLFTLMVGKPPFESKDVKSTYKRILANAYSFPDLNDPSDQARAIIRSMLQVISIRQSYMH